MKSKEIKKKIRKTSLSLCEQTVYFQCMRCKERHQVPEKYDKKDVQKFVEKRWNGLFNILSDLNLSVYKRPLNEETHAFVKYFRKALHKEIEKLKREAGDKLI